MIVIRSTKAEIRLDNLRHNINVMKAGLPAGTKFLGVVKSNAYGHGILETASYLEENGLADHLAVALAEEAFLLRDGGIRLPILILGATFPDVIDEILEKGITATICSLEILSQFHARAEALGLEGHFHFKIDSGMNRIGFRTHACFQKALDFIKDKPHLHFDGMFTHFAVAERADKTFTLQQAEKFDSFLALAKAAGFSPIAHVCNSAATLELPELAHDMVRGGIALYGYHPAGHPSERFDLKPVMTLKTQISHLKLIEPGEGVSYGLRFVADRPTQVATLPLGYGDGYKRIMSGKAEVLIHGRRAPQIGAICMDQCMVDVTDIPDVQVGDEVVLIGRQGSEEITADDLARWAGGTISYEILLSISARVPRVYL